MGKPISDDLSEVVETLSDALNRGFGLIVTSGGVGAEDKDHTVEGIQRIDPEAAVPYVVKFQKGSGRHVKDGVRIGVGSEGLTTMVSLPGPHDEVELAVPILLRGLAENWDKSSLANRLASVLAEKWRQKRPLHHQSDQ